MKILFISHDATRTGAPISLLHIIRWFKNNTDYKFINILGRGGPLEAEFRELGETFIFEDIAKERIPWVQSILGKDPLRMLSYKSFLNKIEKFGPELIYANSVASVDVLDAIKSKYNLPCILHVHELQISIKQFVGENNFKHALSKIDKYIAASEIVKNNLIQNYGIEAANIEVFYEPVDIKRMNQNKYDSLYIKNLKENLEIPSDAFVICGCGTTDWRKGPDLFIHIANLCLDKATKPLFFVWIGGDNQYLEYQKLQYDLNNLGISNFVKFIGVQQNVSQYFAMSDLFLLTSREDPFPLVCLEANAMQLPVFCFKNAGGMPEYISKGGGETFNYLDLISMARKIIEYSNFDAPKTISVKSSISTMINTLDINTRGIEIKKIVEKMLR